MNKKRKKKIVKKEKPITCSYIKRVIEKSINEAISKICETLINKINEKLWYQPFLAPTDQLKPKINSPIVLMYGCKPIMDDTGTNPILYNTTSNIDSNVILDKLSKDNNEKGKDNNES